MNAKTTTSLLIRTCCCVLAMLCIPVLFSGTGRSDDVTNPSAARNQPPPVVDARGKPEGKAASSEHKNLTAATYFAKIGDLRSLEKILAADPGVATRQYKGVGDTALHWAAQYNQAAAAKLLLKYGADMSVTTNTSRHTPLHTAAGSDALSVVEAFIDAGADINCLAEGPLETDAVRARLGLPTTPYVSPLDVAAELGAEHVVEFLLQKGAKLDVNPEKSSFSALHRAMRGNYNRQGLGNPRRFEDPTANGAVGNRKVIELLLSHKADLSTKDFLGNTPFHIGVHRHALDSVEYLLKNHTNKIDVNAPGQFEYTPLQLAVCAPRPDVEKQVKGIITLLREHGANLTLRGGPSFPKQTALEVAQGVHPKEKWGDEILELLHP